MGSKRKKRNFARLLNSRGNSNFSSSMAEAGSSPCCQKLDTGKDDTYCLCLHPSGVLYSGHDSCYMSWKDGKRLEKIPLGGTVTCISSSPVDDNFLAVAVDNAVAVYDRRNTSKPTQEFQFNQEEINQTALNEKGNFLAACDDSGEIKIIDLESNKLYKTLTKHHTNICSSAQFRPSKPLELITGALDCTVIRWDYTKNHPLDKISMQLGEHDSYSINPPMVHAVSVASHGNVFACGLGNGSVAVYKIFGKNITRLACMKKLHQVCCSHLQHAQFAAGKGDCVISGGNDGKVLLFQVTEKQPVHSAAKKPTASAKTSSKGKSKRKSPQNEASAESVVDMDVLLSLQHGSKVNWITSHPEQTHVYVADQTQNISVYNLQL